ncbi:MAG: lipocalin family protein [Syntrophorhabdaceae bacterium]|nr:lipocalin family protein [Syntrophorhabdaceae bacterium]
MAKVKMFLTLLAVFFVLFNCSPSVRQVQPRLEVVKSVDLKRYVGTWYEIASYPASFQKGCTATKAIYALLDDGRVDVLNECKRGAPDAEPSRAKGKAKVVDITTNAKLKVTFFWPFYGDYWIIDLGKNYEYAVVGHPSRKYLWILSREPRMDETLYNTILERLRNEKGYDITKLVKTPQP